ncbi:pentatricopeptide repeat-containing protein At5g18390, mitochondrial isoform X3 [Pistacia vera]|uniref:pentatricopeptide repeat-containing protein At5g18390, mitochondrial isoform X2 n=1 Tax=Pistacia vera TaxID=55513 RepID=UPI001263BC81|nr:pentatricopeptide repeat-containing protein At5g18390, mitochondrial isoform X2 [Pistacia vera]XP_031282629.1 pentatricopeptide repeat-containing protein At5g18390, mitochondrial isoform X3 [Pistacia vera]
MLTSLFKTRTQNPLIHSLKTLATTTSTAFKPSKDDYFAAINHVANIVRHDIYPERTLSKLNLTLTSELVFRVLRACFTSPSESLRFFTWARAHYSPTSLEFEQLIKTLAHHKRYQSMWKIFELMKKSHLSLSSETLCFVVEEFGKHGLVDNAVEIFNKSEVFNCEKSVALYNSLLFALCEVKLFHGAYALIRRMVRKGVVPDKRTYMILVNAWCSSGKLREAQEFLQEMSDKGFNPPVRGRDLLIQGLLNAGYLESAKQMVSKMIKQGFLPDIETFNSLIETICKSGEVEFCVDMYYNACRLGLCVDINTYKILIPAVSKIGMIDEAFRLLNNLVEDGHKPFPSLYAPIIKGMFRRGQFDDGFCFFSEMKIKGHPPNRPVYTMLITMCGRGGKFVDAANYLVEMTEIGLTPISRCFDMVTDGLKNCGKHDLAQKIEQLEVSIRSV